MDMSKKQAEFFTVLILICTVTAAAILIIDYQIKGAILEESNRMRREIEGYYSGQRATPAGGNRPDRDSGNDVSYPSDLVDSGTTGVEKTGSNGSRPTPYPAPAVRRPRAARQNRPGSVPDSGK
jgi:hypothetical protein